MVSIKNERNLEKLRDMATQLAYENDRLVKRTIELERALLEAKGLSPDAIQIQLIKLEETLALREKELFGKSSERLPRGESAPAAPKEPQKGHGPTKQPELPIVEALHTLDEPDKKCPSCGGQLQPWEGQFEESEEIDVIERQFVLRKHKRQKYRCTCLACVETAPAPAKLIPGGRYSTAFAVEVAVQKYCDHLPLERQTRMMEREGLTVSSQTLWDQLEALAKHLTPIHERIGRDVLASKVIHADETRWRLMNGRGQDQGEAPWHVWTLCSPNAVFYRILDGRSKVQARQILGDYGGTVVADGYGVYQSLAKDGPGFRLAGCWAHARRKFIEAKDNYPEPSDAMLELIGELYGVERETQGSLEDRASLRAERSRAIVARIHALATETAARVLPQSAIGKATGYLMNQWKALTVFLEDPSVPIDNNAAERGLRGPVVGRKNHYGSRSKRGTEVAALFYSLIETCKLVGVNPKLYLLDSVNAALLGDPLRLPSELPSAQ